MRIGHGYDVHAFGPGNHVMIGGVRIAYERGLVAHSDGDVLIHAFCDALLGAAALGDIGQHFPDTDTKYQNADSRELLKQVIAKVKNQGWKLSNADVTLVCQEPKMASHLKQMIIALSSDVQCGPEQLNIKATTTENLGFEGRKEGIACHVVVLLQSLE